MRLIREAEYQEGVRQGIERGITRGELLKMISQLRKKCNKGKNAAEAANDLEEEISVIQPLYNLIIQYAQDNDEEILSRYMGYRENDAISG